jgi:glycosyltransferase involved in cell wall biosynthesis
MCPLILSREDTSGGAARAALRLHMALLLLGVNSRMQVAIKKSDISSVDGPGSKFDRALALLRPLVSAAVASLQRTSNAVIHSPALFRSGFVGKLNTCLADVINLHWIGSEFLSVKDIARIRKPIVWTFHDMWPFCGAEHYAPDDASARWRQGYKKKNRPKDHYRLDIDRWTWVRKHQAWRRPIHVVTPSRWLADCVSDSALMGDWPVRVIPNPLDVRQFQPWPKDLARQILNLPQSVPLVLFGAIGGGRDPRKGWDLLQSALALITHEGSGVEGVIFGQSEPVEPPQLGMRLHWLGHLDDDATLALAYSAADVTVVPSRQENLPQTGTEAQSCGCPVVAFNCTGLPDVVEHGVTGYLAWPYEPEDLARGIRWVLADPERHACLSAAARARAVRLWSPAVVVPQYLRAYESAIANGGALQR